MPKRKQAIRDSICKHSTLQFEPSKNAAEVDYKQPTSQQRQNAIQPTGRSSKRSPSSTLPSPSTFPAPLVLPNDELSWDPKYPPQSLKSCTQVRNAATPRRRTIYVVPPPGAAQDMQYVNDYIAPGPSAKKAPKQQKTAKSGLAAPLIEDVTDYLSAFYHGLPVKVLREPSLEFHKWNQTQKASQIASTAKNPHFVGLRAGTHVTRIRARASPDSLFTTQLNLNDVLDVALGILPTDAYALLMVARQDLYEDEPDDFCCGRAYGGSRVAVVSMARYHPVFDESQEVEREHAWPASHCGEYVDACCKAAIAEPKRKQVGGSPSTSLSGTALGAAVAAYSALPTPSIDAELAALWLGRVCKTASHELGHCFGMDHCVYYACVMQSTAGLSEDARQPPYVCPVDLAKLATATGSNEMERCEALLGYAEMRTGDRLFAAFAAWLKARIAELNA